MDDLALEWNRFKSKGWLVMLAGTQLATVVNEVVFRSVTCRIATHKIGTTKWFLLFSVFHWIWWTLLLTTTETCTCIVFACVNENAWLLRSTRYMRQFWKWMMHGKATIYTYTHAQCTHQRVGTLKCRIQTKSVCLLNEMWQNNNTIENHEWNRLFCGFRMDKNGGREMRKVQWAFWRLKTSRLNDHFRRFNVH